MNDLHDLLTDLVEQRTGTHQAEHDPATRLVERALRGARRHRTRAALGAPLAVVVALGLALTGFVTLRGGSSPAARPHQAGPLLGSTRQQAAPLPARLTSPIVLAYQDNCGVRKLPKQPSTRACAQWRVLTANGRQYRIADGTTAFQRDFHDLADSIGGPLAITPDGRTIAYYQVTTHRLVVRDLSSGRVWRSPRRLALAKAMSYDLAFTLSPDGRWLGMSRSSGAHCADSALVEVTGWHHRALSNPELCVLAIGPDAKPVIAENGDGDHYTFFDRNGRKVRSMHAPAEGGTDQPVLTADGRQLVIHNDFGIGDKRLDSAPVIAWADATTGRLVHVQPANPRGLQRRGSPPAARAVGRQTERSVTIAYPTREAGHGPVGKRALDYVIYTIDARTGAQRIRHRYRFADPEYVIFGAAAGG